MTDQSIHAIPENLKPFRSDADAEYGDSVMPFIPQRPTMRPLTDCPVTRDELKAYRETVRRAHRMIELALDKLIGA